MKQDGSNLDIWVDASLTPSLKIDQSVAHDGVCLTVVEMDADGYKVTAIEETLKLTTLKEWEMGQFVNLERAMVAGSRLDGHQVQGHVDGTAMLKNIGTLDGSHNLTFECEERPIVVSKGSVAVNGISLTVVRPQDNEFTVSIIPYTWEHTNLKHLVVGDRVNLEYDILGKYVLQYMERFKAE